MWRELGKRLWESAQLARLHSDASARLVVTLALASLSERPEQVSVALGQPPDYLRSYLEEGKPSVLPPHVRRRLAAHLGVPEQALRG